MPALPPLLDSIYAHSYDANTNSLTVDLNDSLTSSQFIIMGPTRSPISILASSVIRYTYSSMVFLAIRLLFAEVSIKRFSQALPKGFASIWQGVRKHKVLA